ncbi:MAG: YlxR family protein, partial [Actinomycetota bacterium]
SAPGRGAYVHLDAGCIEAAMRSRAFDRALRTGLTADAAARLGNGSDRSMGAV